jgi:glycosyltransferase involved in cell wall biosynthesis
MDTTCLHSLQLTGPLNPAHRPVAQGLTWALVIATYKRKHILPRCLRLAAQQTRPPQEIVVVDASPDWEDNNAIVRQTLADLYPLEQLTYVPAQRPSSTAQRNQGIDLAQADVVFLIDDDSLMYPTCAAEVMAVYEADWEQRVQGVQCLPSLTPPDLQRDSPPPPQAQGANAIAPSGPNYPRQTWLRRRVKKLLNNEQTYFLPYDPVPPRHAMPESLAGLNVGAIQVMTGYAMTLRREIAQRERFSEVLERYAAGEDQDLSYRVSRHGLLVNALDARLCHLEISGGRLSTYTVTVLAGLNMAVLHQFHGGAVAGDRAYIQRAWRRMVRKRILISFLKEISERHWRFPRTRGYWFALSWLGVIYGKSPQELQGWYPQFQQALIAADGNG